MCCPLRMRAACLSPAQVKEMFVSPFIGMDQTYRFDVNRPGERSPSASARPVAEGETLIATQSGGRPRADRPPTLAAHGRRFPLMTFKVMAAIHWEALRLALKGVPLPPLSGGRRRLQTRGADAIRESAIHSVSRAQEPPAMTHALTTTEGQNRDLPRWFGVRVRHLKGIRGGRSTSSLPDGRVFRRRPRPAPTRGSMCAIPTVRPRDRARANSASARPTWTAGGTRRTCRRLLDVLLTSNEWVAAPSGGAALAAG
jgi:hypothetical protein